MFIIYGWGDHPETIGQGTFFCPACQGETAYQHRQMRTWAKIFFIPIIPLAAGQHYVECGNCRGTFVEAILESPGFGNAPQTYRTGERVLGKRGEFWYPGTVIVKSGKKYKIDFDDDKQDLLGKSDLMYMDLREGDPIYVRSRAGAEYLLGNITAFKDDKLQVQFPDGTQASTSLENVRVIWNDDGSS